MENIIALHVFLSVKLIIVASRVLKHPCSSDSYRPIALAPTLSKVFEWCLLLLDRDAFSTSPLQFGFKEGFSSDLCTGLLKNIAPCYTINDSVVYGCFLDASKAFDHVNHSVHFEKLLRRKLSSVLFCTCTLRLTWYSFADLYTDQRMCVRWNHIPNPTSSTYPMVFVRVVFCLHHLC